MTSPVAKRPFDSLFPTGVKGTHMRVPGYMMKPVPGRKLLEGAKCRPSDALHFVARTKNDDDVYERTTNGEQGTRDQAARKVCNGTPPCPVRARCLLWALQSRTTGVAGGIVVTQATLGQYKRAKKTAVVRKAEAVHEKLRRANGQAG